jgi:hypothetical protein
VVLAEETTTTTMVTITSRAHFLQPACLMYPLVNLGPRSWVMRVRAQPPRLRATMSMRQHLRAAQACLFGASSCLAADWPATRAASA